MKPGQTRKRPTIKDVAEQAGVSRTTVSYVINNKTGGNIRISDATRERVWEAAKALKYRPISAARTLRTRRSNLLALMVPYIETPFNPLFAAAVQREAEKSNLGVIIYAPRDDLRREEGFVDDCISRGVDGFVAQTYRLSEDDIGRLVEAGIAVVIHGITPTHPFADNVVFDEVRAVEEVIAYLIDKGHRRIGTIAGPQDRWPGRLRKEGYVNALRAHGIPIADELICEVDSFRRGSGVPGIQRLLALPEPPTAVFASNDVHAVDALLFALDAGLSVPGDLAIVGFDDTPEATTVRPRLTTIHKDTEWLGTTAVQMVVERIASQDPIPSRRKVLDLEIMVRESA